MVMEFAFDVNSLFPQAVTRTVGGQLPTCRHLSSDVVRERLATVVNEMGLASAKAQGLRVPITSYQRLSCFKQTLYVMKEDNCSNGKGVIVGILKTGQKNLFLNNAVGGQHEVSPLCVLDFYVHESRQRCGYGKTLFEAMLKAENLSPFEVAIDRPSPKFLGFLKKHYKLQSYVRQANNYVVFDQFFTTCTDISHKSRRSLLQKSDANPSSLNDTSKSSPEKGTELFKSQTFQSGPSLSFPPIETTNSIKEVALGDSTSLNVTVNRSVNNSDICSPKETTATPKTNNKSSNYGGKFDDVTMMSPSADLPKSHPQQAARKTRFDIITGRLLQPVSDLAHETSLQTSFAHSPSAKITKDPLSHSHTTSSTDAGDGVEVVQKAPYLNMRQTSRNQYQKNSSFGGVSHGLSTYRAAFQATARGFYSSSCSMLGPTSTAVPSASVGVGGSVGGGGGGPWDPTGMAAMRYSKHALPQSTRSSKSAPQSSFALQTAVNGNPLLGTKWSSSSRNMSASKLKDKWKTFIL